MNDYLENEYVKYYDRSFNKTSRKIYELLKENIKNKECRILEIGCASGHISFKLALEGYNISGIEIREKVVNETIQRIKEANVNFKIYLGDILKHNEKYDFVWSSGLLQCFSDKQKYEILNHIKSISQRAIFVVPERNTILKAKNENSELGVNGCVEYPTNTIPYILSQFYNIVRVGEFIKEDLNMDCNFNYYICE